jgi:hypothetical protein
MARSQAFDVKGDTVGIGLIMENILGKSRLNETLKTAGLSPVHMRLILNPTNLLYI